MSIETRVAQKDKLYALLVVQKEFESLGTTDKLKWLIKNARAVMDAEDVAYVEKQVASDE